MVRITEALKAKSDQINAADLSGCELFGTIIRAEYHHGREQSVEVFFDSNPLPWRPSKGMCRVMSDYWTDELDCWIGKDVRLYKDKRVRWAGKEDGGIRINGLSDIPLTEEVRVKEGRNFWLVYKIAKLSKKQLNKETIPLTPQYTPEQLNKVRDDIIKLVAAILDFDGITAILNGERLAKLKMLSEERYDEVVAALTAKQNELKETTDV
jgi:hypothetical protein